MTVFISEEAIPSFSFFLPLSVGLMHCFVVALLFDVNGKHLRSCRDGQLT